MDINDNSLPVYAFSQYCRRFGIRISKKELYQYECEDLMRPLGGSGYLKEQIYLVKKVRNEYNYLKKLGKLDKVTEKIKLSTIHIVKPYINIIIFLNKFNALWEKKVEELSLDNINTLEKSEDDEAVSLLSLENIIKTKEIITKTKVLIDNYNIQVDDLIEFRMMILNYGTFRKNGITLKSAFTYLHYLDDSILIQEDPYYLIYKLNCILSLYVDETTSVKALLIGRRCLCGKQIDIKRKDQMTCGNKKCQKEWNRRKTNIQRKRGKY